jgi:type II secretory pathway pseudopilin PulG
MNSSLTNQRTSRRAFTLVEIMVATVLVGAVGMIMFSVMISTMKLSTKNVVTNLSNHHARQTLDRIGEIVRYAQDTPVLINANGTTASGGTSDGLFVKNSQGGPYVFKNSNGQADADIPSDAKIFSVEYAAAAGLSAPEIGDFFAVALATQPQLEVVGVGTPTVSGSISKVQVTTRQALGETAKVSSYTASASRYRKEAFIFVQSGTYWDLRHYGKITPLTNYTDSSSYKVIASGFQKLGGQPWFTTGITVDGTQSASLRALARSSNRAEYAEIKSGRTTLTSMPIQIKLWNYKAPPPPPAP